MEKTYGKETRKEKVIIKLLFYKLSRRKINLQRKKDGFNTIILT